MGTSIDFTTGKAGRPLRGSVAMVPLVTTTMKGPSENGADSETLVVGEGVTEDKGGRKEEAMTEAERVSEIVKVAEGEKELERVTVFEVVEREDVPESVMELVRVPKEVTEELSDQE